MYTLHAQGEILTFATMGEFLYHLNQAQETFADLSQMSLEYKNVRYPIGRNQGTRGIFPDFSSDPMSAFFWLHIWLNEVLPFVGATAIPGLAVAPHLITRPNWGAVSELSSVAYGTYRVFSQQQRCASGNLEDWFRSNFLERFGYGHNGPSYDGHDQNSRHEVHVCYALARGDYVPEEVVAEYLQNPELVRYDSKWFRAVLEKPFLRGRFKSIGHLRDIVNIVGADNLTVENVPAFVAVLGSLPAEASTCAIDDVLYGMGVVSQRPQPPTPTDEEIGEPVNELAEKLRTALAADRAAEELSFAQNNLDKGNMSRREFDRAKALALSNTSRETYGWANRVAQAVADKRLEAMLGILDGPGNEVSQKVIEAEFGIKLRNVTAAERRRAIFSLAGFVEDDAVKTEEARLDAVQKVRKAERDFRDATERASNFRIRIDDGEPMTGALYVDTLVSRGFNTIESRKKGAAQSYFLFNSSTGCGYPITNANGTFEYARLLLARTPAPAAQELAIA